MLQDKVIGIYCLIDDILKGIGHYEHKERQVSDGEVMTTALPTMLLRSKNCARPSGRQSPCSPN